MGKIKRHEKLDGTPVQLYQCGKDDKNQQFEFDEKEDKWIWNKTSCVGLANGNADNGNSRLQVFDCGSMPAKNGKWDMQTWK